MIRPLLLSLAAALMLFMAPALAQTRAPAAANPAPANPAEGIIGTILEVEGAGGFVTPAGSATKIVAQIKTPIHMHDVVTTNAKSRIFILFIDDTKITLSENTKLTVDKYVFNPDDNTHNSGIYSVLSGSFEYVSGLLAKKKDPDVTIRTQYGNIGIRGTKLWGGAIGDKYGVHVDEGLVRVRNDGGEVMVPNGKGTFIQSPKQKPTAAAPFPPEALQFIQGSVFLAGQALLEKRIAGFSGQQAMLRDQFKNFLKIPGNMPGLENIPGGNSLPFAPNGRNKAPSPSVPKNPKDLLKGFPF